MDELHSPIFTKHNYCHTCIIINLNNNRGVMSRSPTRTILSLDKYAKILGINPVFFNGGAEIHLADGRTLFNMDNAQNDIWPQYSWQNADQVSRDELSRLIRISEEEIIKQLGSFPVPMWTVAERTHLPFHFRPEYQSPNMRYDVANNDSQIKTGMSNFISGGRRATTLIDGRASVVYSDPDGDGWDELATISSTVPIGTDVKELKIYYEGYGPKEEYEIRDCKTKVVVNDTLTVTYNAWMMIDPELYEVFPSDDTDGKYVNMDDTNSFVTTVEVYREYNDTTQDHVLFYANNISDGSQTSQGGFLYPSSGASLDYVSPVEADYNTTTGLWERVYTQCAYSDYVDLWYYSGMKAYSSNINSTDDYLPLEIATAIAYMATARLERVFYANNNSTSLASSLREDMLSWETGTVRVTTDIARNNPFGSKVGEVKAWTMITKFITSRRFGGAVI
jgi:hypothetical protein